MLIENDDPEDPFFEEIDDLDDPKNDSFQEEKNKRIEYPSIVANK